MLRISHKAQISLVGPCSGGVRLIEMRKNAVGHWAVTGRQLLVPPDSPILEWLGEAGSRAIAEGSAAMPSELFNVIIEVVEEQTGESLSFKNPETGKQAPDSR